MLKMCDVCKSTILMTKSYTKCVIPLKIVFQNFLKLPARRKFRNRTYDTCIWFMIHISNVYSSPNTTRRPKTTENNQDDWLWVVIVIGIVVVFVCVSSCMLYFHRKKSECIKRIIHIPFPFYTLMRSRHQY